MPAQFYAAFVFANESSLPTLNVSQGRNTIILDNGAPTSGCVGGHREGRPVDELARQGPQSRNGRRCLVERADLRHVGKSCSLRAGVPREHITGRRPLGSMTQMGASAERLGPTMDLSTCLSRKSPSWSCFAPSRWTFSLTGTGKNVVKVLSSRAQRPQDCKAPPRKQHQ